jgi:hypothetical protein
MIFEPALKTLPRERLAQSQLDRLRRLVEVGAAPRSDGRKIRRVQDLR